jgi:glycosyltransferase involved in cell wall biosynthesis
MRLRAHLSWELRDPRPEVLVVTNLWPDAQRPVYGIFVERQVQSLRVLGVRCDVLYLRGYATPRAYLQAAAAFVRLGSLAGRYKLVHVHAGETALPARLLRGIPALVSFCGDDLLGNPAADGSMPVSSRVRRQLVRQGSRLYAATITKSREMAKALPAPVRSRNRVLPNGVDRDLFRPGDRTAARAALGWDPDERIALFAATRTYERRKRLWLARAACERAAAQIGPVGLHLAQNVAPAEMPLLMNAADCLLFTSAIEGSPNVVKEALMCDLPVVSTAVGDVGELLEGVNPSAVTAADPDALAAGLVPILSSRSRSNGRAAAARLDERAIAQRLRGIYEELARDEVGRARPAEHSPVEAAA